MKIIEKFLKTTTGKFIAIVITILVFRYYFSPYEICMRNHEDLSYDKESLKEGKIDQSLFNSLKMEAIKDCQSRTVW